MKRWKILCLLLLAMACLVGCDVQVGSDTGTEAVEQQEETTYPGEGFYVTEDYDPETVMRKSGTCIIITAEEWEGLVLYQIEFGMSTNRYASYIDEIDGTPTEIISFSFDPNSSEGIPSVSEATVAVSLDGDVATVVHTDAYGSNTTIYTRMQG